jgi:hypothetical protein
MILKGKYCPDCAKRIGVQLEQLKNELSPKQERQHKNIYSMVVDKDMAPGGKMHFLQNASRERRSNSESHIIDDEHDT